MLKSYVRVADRAGSDATRKRKAPKRVQTIRAEKRARLGFGVAIMGADDAIPRVE